MLLILVIGEILALLIGEGIFQIGLMIPLLWWLYVSYGEDKNSFLLIQIVTLSAGLVGSIITGTVLGGLSSLWLLSIWIFKLLDKMFVGGKIVWMIPVLVFLSFIGDKLMGLRWSIGETVLLVLVGVLAFVASQNNRSIRLKTFDL